MTAVLPPPSSPQPASSSGQLRKAAAATTRPAPTAPARYATLSPARRPWPLITRVTATAPIPEPSTSTASGNPAVAGLPVSCSASSAPAVPPAARPRAPNNCATTSTRIVRRSSNRGGNDGDPGTGRTSSQKPTGPIQPRPVEARRPTPIRGRFTRLECQSDRRGRCRRMAGELDLRLLRHFVAVAEELHFTRAAARLYLAQQALSRDISRLERQLGVRLFTRTTRRVALTAEGERLLVRARQLLALHDQTLQELGGHDRPLLVDLLAEGHTPTRVLHGARQRVPHVELVGRFHGGLGAALHLLLAGGLDVAFGRSEGLGQPFPTQLVRRLVRLEPLALLLPQEDPLAALDAVPLAALHGTQVDISAGNEQAPEWVDLGMRLLAAFGAEPSPPHPHAEGLEETVRHLHAEGSPILTLLERPVAPGVVVRPLVDPVPLYPWTMVFHRNLRHPGLDALQASADELGRRGRWLELPPGPWLPESDTAVFGLDEGH